MRVRSVVGVAVAGVIGSLAVVAAPTAASALQTQQSTMVSAKPATYTPDVANGVVYAINQVGSTVFLGGSFTSIAPHASTATTTVSHLAAFTAGTGALVTSFAPTTNGTVETIIPGPTANTVYVGGDFKTIDGVTSHLALLDATTGALVPGWKSPAVDGVVNKLLLANGQLFVGGTFDAIGGSARGGFASLNPTTGALTKYSQLSFTGHHNYLVNCTPTAKSSCADGGVGVKSMDVSPDGTRMVVIGNFTNVSGSARDQVAMLDLSSTGATVDANWDTDAYTAACASSGFDSWIRDVQFSPDGSYFAIVGTGGGFGSQNSDKTLGLCDAVSKWNTSDTGADVQPAWIDYTGNDSFWTVSVTGTAIYEGGHERWLNNSNASDRAGAGSVPRPGIAAVDPVNGMPLAWNPGRNPRGAGAYALYASSDGLYVGSDTEWIGNFTYHHKRVAFFPLAGGETLPTNPAAALPGDIYLFGQTGNAAGVKSVAWDGATAPTAGPAITGFDASTVRGAFAVNGQLYIASSDGNFYSAPFNGRSIGAKTAIDPYDDPVWSGVQTGSGQTYRGVKSGFYSEMSSLTSLFYSNGRIYYTKTGSSHMFSRYFETDDGVIGSQEFTTTDTNNWSNTAGAFVSGSTLYFASSTTGNLMSVPFTNGQASGTPTVADSSMNWAASHGMALLSASQVPANKPPAAAFTISCTTTAAACSADASASVDPDGTITGYSWSWGDGTTSQTTAATTSHTYSTAGSYTVALTATDNSGATTTVSHSVHVTSPTAAAIAFRANSTYDGNAAKGAVTVPAAAQAGDELLLFESYASSTVTDTAPAGWTKVGSTSHSNLTSVVYAKPATAADAGTTVTIPFSTTVKAQLTLADYANAGDPVEVSASATDASTASHTSPTVAGLGTGSVAVTFWTEKSSTTSAWTAPAGVTVESQVFGTGAGTMSGLLADSGGAVTGSYGGKTATSNVTSGSGASWTIGLSPAG